MDGPQSGNATAETDERLNTGDVEVRVRKASWEPSVLSSIGKEIHYFAGHEINIWESLDSYGSVIWPAALALCHYLESNRATVDLLDKAVLEIGSGTGLVSIVASLLGAWVTATDLPEVLGNLRCNLSRNTRGRCRYTPQVAELSWGHELEKTFPHSVYRYDYILAADVVYHHDFLAELLVTMQHFCQPRTTLIWANKTRFGSDLVFVENFKKTFNTTLLADNGEVKIYSATVKDESAPVTSKQTEGVAKKQVKDVDKNESKPEIRSVVKLMAVEQVKENDHKDVQRKPGYVVMENREETLNLEDGNEEDNMDLESKDSGDGRSETDSTFVEQKSENENVRSLAPAIYYRPEKEVYHFLGQRITIEESIDSYGATIWPAALALCRFLETPQGRQQIDLLDKSVLELGAGTGLLSVVVTLLGAKLTATDLPEILSKLTCNLNRNTRGRRRHEPQVAELSWGHKLDEAFPRSTHQYDYVLATDVVYHHDFLAELLVTMRHFCQPGTTLVWANNVRFASDLGFIDNFHRYFDIALLEELDDVRIYVATSKISEKDDDKVQETSEEVEDNGDLESSKRDAGEPNSMSETGDNAEELEQEQESDDTQSLENDTKEKQVQEEVQDSGRFGEEEAEPDITETPKQRTWAPTVYYSNGKETYSFLGHETRHHWRHEPRVTALAWGYKLEETFPRSTHHYDYVLAADVVYHHDYLPELLVTMRHFCGPKTTLIFANKVRYQADLVFIGDFQKAFSTTLLTEMDEVRIYSATMRI
ncbi:protein-lysine methyltransferase METTL21C [Pimephales promelas]|nr:protein-lysine methyltransferase METTL21C [Pimephales promelas]